MRDIEIERLSVNVAQYGYHERAKRCPSCGSCLHFASGYRHAFLFERVPPRGHQADLIDTCNTYYCRSRARELIEQRNGARTVRA